MRRLIIIVAELMMITAFKGPAHASMIGNCYINETFFNARLKVVERGGRTNFTLHTVTKLTAQIYAGEIEGTAPITDHAAVFQGKQGCVLKIRFAGNGEIAGGGTTRRHYIGLNGNFDWTC